MANGRNIHSRGTNRGRGPLRGVPNPIPFSKNDPNLRVYGPDGEVDPIEALDRQARHLSVRDLQRRGYDKQEIAERLKITEEEVEESHDPKIPNRGPRRLRPQ